MSRRCCRLSLVIVLSATRGVLTHPSADVTTSISNTARGVRTNRGADVRIITFVPCHCVCRPALRAFAGQHYVRTHAGADVTAL